MAMDERLLDLLFVLRFMLCRGDVLTLRKLHEGDY